MNKGVGGPQKVIKSRSKRKYGVESPSHQRRPLRGEVGLLPGKSFQCLTGINLGTVNRGRRGPGGVPACLAIRAHLSFGHTRQDSRPQVGVDSDRVVMSQPSGPAGRESRRRSNVIEKHLTKTLIGRGELALASGVFLVGQRTMSSKLTPHVGRALQSLRGEKDALPKPICAGAALWNRLGSRLPF